MRFQITKLRLKHHFKAFFETLGKQNGDQIKSLCHDLLHYHKNTLVMKSFYSKLLNDVQLLIKWPREESQKLNEYMQKIGVFLDTA